VGAEGRARSGREAGRRGEGGNGMVGERRGRLRRTEGEIEVIRLLRELRERLESEAVVSGS